MCTTQNRMYNSNNNYEPMMNEDSNRLGDGVESMNEI